MQISDWFFSASALKKTSLLSKSKDKVAAREDYFMLPIWMWSENAEELL